MPGPLLPPPPIAATTVATNELRREFQTLLLSQAQMLGRRQLRIKIPRAGATGPREDMAYHFRPELQIQLDGESEFNLPDGDSLLLRSGEMAVMPPLVPHRLVDRPDAPSRRLVVGFYSSAVSMHFGRRAWNQEAALEAIGLYPTANLRQIVDLSALLIAYAHGSRLHREQGENAVAAALLWLLVDLLDDEVPETDTDSNRLFQIKWLVHSHLSNPDLGVKFLSEQMRCSPSHLSHLFAKESDQPLTQYIHEQRVARAMEALGSNKLTISEIAWACGFADPGYFSRVFRKQTGLTPQACRKKLEDDARLTLDD
ncbi:MAG: helix-turn-helix domain-containing protein [Verrucomicrobiota bacterium]